MIMILSLSQDTKNCGEDHGQSSRKLCEDPNLRVQGLKSAATQNERDGWKAALEKPMIPQLGVADRRFRF